MHALDCMVESGTPRMTPARPCPECGSPLAPDAPGGLCPRCLVRAGLEILSADERAAGTHPTQVIPQDAAPSPPPAAPPRPRFGDYELLRQIAQGGMGVVYEARQVSLDRKVALKMIRSGQLATPVEVQRFHTEAAAAARLDHPNIVPIHDIGEHEGQHYFTMKLVEGGSLADWNAECRVRNAEWTRRAARLLACMARAVHFAHQHGVLHRDLKPTNILLDAAGQPQLTDFGLARIIEQSSSLTQSRAVMGSASYMSPEQAAGQNRRLTTATDIYSLGAVLYEMLTGQPPFRGETLLETLRQAVEAEPVRPGTINPSVDRDLETICLKCLEKRPQQRYPSAEALANDLDRWLAGEPIEARPSSTWERTIKWARRKPAIAALLGVVALVSLAGLGGILWQWRQTEAAARALRRNLYVADLNLAQRALNENNLGRAVELISKYVPRAGEEDLRGFEWRLLWKQTRGSELATLVHGNFVEAVAFSPDGKALASIARAGLVRVWDAATRQLLSTLAVPDVPVEHGPTLLFSPDGRFLAARLGAGQLSTVWVWETKSWQEVAKLAGLEPPVFFLPDSRALGARVAGSVALWDTATWQRQANHSFAGLDSGIALSPNGQVIATLAGDSQVRIWDVTQRRCVHQFILSAESQADPPIRFAVSSDARWLAYSTWKGQVGLWDARASQAVAAWKAHTSSIFGLAFSPDSRTLATGGFDQAIHLWDAQTQARLATLRGHLNEVWCVAFSTDGRFLASGSKDATARLWPARPRPDDPGLPGAWTPLAFLKEGAHLVALTPENDLAVWDVAKRQRLQTLARTDAELRDRTALALSHDGDQIVVGTRQGRVRIWTTRETGRKNSFLAHPGPVSSVDTAPDEHLVATAGSDGVKLWDPVTGSLRRTLDGAKGPVRFAPDGQTLATAGPEYTAILWDISSGMKRATLDGHKWTVVILSFSPDGRRLVTASTDATARIWRADNGRLVAVLTGHKEGIPAVAFTPDGRTLATGSTDDTVKLWSMDNFQDLLTLTGAGEDVGAVLFSPDGQTLTVGGLGSSGNARPLQLWRAPALDEIDSAGDPGRQAPRAR
jgi:eukaryotic-like serine/threonine-protein kinase